LLALLILPVYSLAQETAPGAASASCACQPMAADCAAGDSGASPEQHSGGCAGDCCGSEEFGSDSGEARPSRGLILKYSATFPFPPDSGTPSPKVYLSIFVPPEG
jgi:hypothetical protein